MGINIAKKTSIANTTELKNRKIEYIVVHYTAGITSKPGAALNTASWFSNLAAKASADFIVDDGSIVQFNPDIRNRYCWHCGGNKYNNKGGSLYGIAKNSNSIGIEICSINKKGKMTRANDGNYDYTLDALDRAEELITFLMKEYNISVDHIIRHYDVNGKPCPGIIGWNAESGDESKWKAFKNRFCKNRTIKVPQASKETEISLYPNTPFTVKVLIDDLNYRSEPSMSGKIKGQTGKGIFTITETSGGWGRLKSGIGWIWICNPAYCTICKAK